MEKIKLEANGRDKKGGLSALRKTGVIPAVLYGKKREPKILQLPLKSLEKAIRSETGLNTIFDLTVDGKGEGLVRIREYQADPLKRNLIHVDLQAVDLKEKIEVEVPVHIIGKAAGVKNGGILEQQRRSLLLKCLVTNIPDHIEIDVSPLEIGQSVHADEVQLPEGVEFPHETNFVILAVVPPVKEEEVKSAEAAAVAATAEGAPAVGGAAAAPAAGEPKEKGKAEEAKGKETKKAEK